MPRRGEERCHYRRAVDEEERCSIADVEKKIAVL
jgi:hypothetical protein